MKPRKVHILLEIESSSTLSKLRSLPSYATLICNCQYYMVEVKKFYLPKKKKKSLP